jgi:glycosyltransferase involved in cell wall biosynthesis
MMKAVMVPHDHEYLHRLRQALAQEDIEVSLFPPFHYATPYNFVRLWWLRRQGYSVVHVHWLYVFPFMWLMKLFVAWCRVLGFRVVWTVHNVLPHEADRKDVEKTRWFYSHADAVFVHYEANVDRLRETLQVDTGKVTVIAHPTFEDSYPNTIGREESRRILDIPLDAKVVLCFGQMRPYKGMEVFAEAIAELGDEYLGMVVGAGQSRQVLDALREKEYMSSNLRVVAGYVPDDEMQLYFNAADIVALPYLRITTSGVVPLAYSFHRPVVTTRSGGMPEVVREGETGLLVPPGDADALREAIVELFSMDIRAMGDLAYEWATTRFSWSRLAMQTARVYGEVTG